MAHSNISIFVPHIGCPCKCSFCNQFSITSQHYSPKPDDVDKAVSDNVVNAQHAYGNGENYLYGGAYVQDYYAVAYGIESYHRNYPYEEQLYSKACNGAELKAGYIAYKIGAHYSQ